MSSVSSPDLLSFDQRIAELESRCENDGRCRFGSLTSRYCLPCWAAITLVQQRDRLTQLGGGSPIPVPAGPETVRTPAS